MGIRRRQVGIANYRMAHVRGLARIASRRRDTPGRGRVRAAHFRATLTHLHIGLWLFLLKISSLHLCAICVCPAIPPKPLRFSPAECFRARHRNWSFLTRCDTYRHSHWAKGYRHRLTKPSDQTVCFSWGRSSPPLLPLAAARRHLLTSAHAELLLAEILLGGPMRCLLVVVRIHSSGVTAPFCRWSF